jgi:hypothetical protein
LERGGTGTAIDRRRVWCGIGAIPAAGTEDRLAGVVADASVDSFDDVPAVKLGQRARKVPSRLRLPKWAPGQGGDQTQEEHRKTPHRKYLPALSWRDRPAPVKYGQKSFSPAFDGLKTQRGRIGKILPNSRPAIDRL